MYLDNAATTPLTSDVKNYIISILDMYANPSSQYDMAKDVRKIIDTARDNVYKFINATPKDGDVIFTSSGSASNNLAIRGLINYMDYHCNKEVDVYYSPTSHKSMYKVCEDIALISKRACDWLLNVDNLGRINIVGLESKLIASYKSHCIPVVCFEAANSETGTIQNIKEITDLVHKYNGIVICDFTGYIPYIKLNVKDLDVDIATFSGHKLNALKGVGVLYKKSGIDIKPLIYGSQEYGLFGGTEDVIGIASLGKAIEKYSYKDINTDIRDFVFNVITEKIPDVCLVGSHTNRLPYNLYLAFKGVDSQQLVALLNIQNIQVSTGSACNNGDATPSQTLIAIGLDNKLINSCIRLTFSGKESKGELIFLCNIIRDCVKFLRN